MKNDHPNGQPAASPRSLPAEDTPGLSDSLRRFGNQAPSESLGLPQGNSLTMPFLQATVISLVLLALLTVGPYFFGDSPQTVDAKAATPAEKQEPSDASKTAPPVSPGPENIAKAPGSTPKAPAGKSDILEKLGENTTKTAPAKVNPLDKKDDDILKDLK